MYDIVLLSSFNKFITSFNDKSESGKICPIPDIKASNIADVLMGMSSLQNNSEQSKSPYS